MLNIIIPEENLINLSDVVSADKMLFELDENIEQTPIQGKVFTVNLGNVYYTAAHINTLKTLLEEHGASINLIVATSVNTQLAAIEAGLTVSEKIPEKTLQTKAENTYETLNNQETEEIQEPTQLKITVDIDQEEASQKQEDQDPQPFETQDIDTEKMLEEFLENEINKEEAEKQNETIEIKPVSKKSYSDNTLYIKQTLRSGRTINYDGNVFIIGDCHPGSEIIASGDINVWGILSGIAHAGSKGDTTASIRALKINAIQLRIANMLSRRPDKLLIEKANKTNNFTPEEAKIENDKIQIFSYNY